ncbi:hypothetical protein MRB53_030552 [Persea americana]|uniref:Uncharacterized protein n=1 Tax=Persea americana TaxID=3435 RepID=A0ACC2KLX0_PERAE|nr:hypothetical protein MRB53_030552 [Persea americana]
MLLCFSLKITYHTVEISAPNHSLSIDEYVKKIKHIVDSLATVCSPVDDEDIIIYTLNGLPPEYGSFRTSIRTRSAPILLEELHVLLQCEELNLDITQTSSTNILTTAMVASKEANKSGTPFNNRGGKSNFHGRGRGYCLNYKGYRCLDLSSGRLYLSRHVVFDESFFPFASVTHTTNSSSKSPLVDVWLPIFTHPISSSLSPTSVPTPPQSSPSTSVPTTTL